MNPTEYQRLAARTECDQHRSRRNFYDKGLGDFATPHALTPVRLNHGALGIVKEGGEILAEVEKWLYYNQPLDVGKVKEELGDVLWYAALVANALGVDLGEVMRCNLAKLEKRYPDRYNDDRAKDRDPAAEAEAVRRAPLTVRLQAEPIDPYGKGYGEEMEAVSHCHTHEWKLEGAEKVLGELYNVYSCEKCRVVMKVKLNLEGR